MFTLTTFLKRLLPITTLMVVVSPAWGQGLTLEQAWDQALTRSPVVGQRRAETLEQEAVLDEAYVEARPQLKLNLQSQAQGPQPSLNLPGRQITLNPIDTHSAAISLEQSLTSFGRVGARSQTAQAALEASHHRQFQSQDQVALEVSDAYLEVLSQQELVETAHWQVKAAQRALEDAENGYEVGTAPAFDTVRADSRLARAESELTARKLALENARAQLRRLLGQPNDTALKLTPPLLVHPPEEHEPNYGQRPELRAADLNLRAAQARVDQTRAEGGPQLGLRASLAQQTETPFTPGTQWSVGLNFSYAFADGGRTEARTNQARARVAQQEEQVRDLRERLALEEIVASNQLESDWSVMTSAAAERKAAAEATRISELRYRAGVAPSLELLETQADYAQAWSREVNARYTYQKNYYRWLRASANPSWRSHP